jgi:nuclease HARBI1
VDVIKFPEDTSIVKQRFHKICAFPSVIGCVDGTHLPLKKPRNYPEPEIFRCRKGYFSLNAQVIAGPDYKFYDVVCRWPGSTHNSRIFKNSFLNARFPNGNIEGILLGDAGYPCLP